MQTYDSSASPPRNPGDFNCLFKTEAERDDWHRDRVRRPGSRTLALVSRVLPSLAPRRRLQKDDLIISKNKMPSHGKFRPVQVSVDQTAQSLMAEIWQSSRCKNRAAKMELDFWSKIPLNRQFENSPAKAIAEGSEPEGSVTIVSLIDTRFPSLLSRLEEITKENVDFEIVIVVAEPLSLTHRNWQDLKKRSEDLRNPVQVLFSDKNNISHNRNLAVKASRGTEHIIFLDDDVKLVDNPLTKLIAALKDDEQLGVISIPSYSRSKNLKLKKPLQSSLKFWRTKELAFTNIVAGMVMATRREIARATPFLSLLGNAGDDIHFVRQVHLLGYLGAYIFPQDAHVIDEDPAIRATRTGPL
jgi:hypothetical protein